MSKILKYIFGFQIGLCTSYLHSNGFNIFPILIILVSLLGIIKIEKNE